MTASLDSEAKVRLSAHLPVSSGKSVNFEPAGYSLKKLKEVCYQKAASLYQWQGLQLGPGKAFFFFLPCSQTHFVERERERERERRWACPDPTGWRRHQQPRIA
jgi:hypothetical protein